MKSVLMTPEELEAEYGMAASEVEALASDAEKGILHGEVRKVVMGRPLMFGEEMKQISFKEPVCKIDAIDMRASQLGMKRSDYLRYLIDEDLRLSGYREATPLPR